MPDAVRPVTLCILDGWGWREAREANAPALAHTPNYDALWAETAPVMLGCSGPAVGLPEGQMGNSEVGHITIGAGRVIWMDLPRIDQAIETGDFAASPALAQFAARLQATGGAAHLMGLLGPGGVHAHHRHLAAAAKALAAAGVPVLLHLFTDGRDTPPGQAAAFLHDFDAARAGAGRIATISGRYYAMDRDQRWERVGRVVDLILTGAGARAESAEAALAAAASRGEGDEFTAPTAIGDYAGAKDGDGIFFANFRADRARQILSALADPEFSGYETGARPEFAARLGMVSYSDAHDRFMDVMFPADAVTDTLGDVVSAAGLRQLRLAETEKYPHVTFFLNGGRETPGPGEVRIMAQSPKVATYDLAPEMAAAEVASNLVAGISGGEYALIIANFANPDMVGHTGDLDAAIKACEAVDIGLGAAIAATRAAGGAMIVCADHGNCEMMIDPASGGPHTAHTTTPVPAFLVGGPPGARLAGPGGLCDLAPTVLALLGVEAPAAMTGRALLAGS